LGSPAFSKADETFNVKYYEPRPSDTVKVLLEKGERCVKLHEDATALLDYEAVLKRGKPDDVVAAYIGVGNVYFGNHDYDKALDSFNKAAMLADKEKSFSKSDPFRGRAKVFMAMGKYQLALADMNHSMKAGLTDGRLEERAAILTRLKQYPLAIEDYTALIHMSPKDSTVYYKRAKLYETVGRPAEAARDRAQGNALSRDLY